MNNTNNVKVDVNNITREEIPKYDITPHIGKETRIEKADVYEGEYGYYLKVEGAVVDTIGKDDKKKEIRASAILGLFTNKEGKIIIGVGSAADTFMQMHKAKDFKDLVGKSVIMTSKLSKDKKTEFLTFRGAA